MIFHADKQYGSPLFAIYFDSLPIPSAKKLAAVAKLFDVSPNTVKRWLSGAQTPPRAAVIALFHESPYGLSATSTHSANAAALARGLADSYKSTNQKLLATIDALVIALAEAKTTSTEQRHMPMNDPIYSFSR